MPKPPVVRGGPRTTSSQQVLQTYQWMEKNGFRAVPLHKASKAATSRAYVETTYEPPSIDYWRNNDLGIGCVTGPLHGGPVDFDLDCEEAVFFARFFLPGTHAVFGREGKRRSHFLYRVDAPSFEKQAFIDPVTTKTIVEVRGDGGHQTVMPGSIHEGSGELVEWDSHPFPEVSTLSPEQLARAVRKIALCTLIARYIWQDGYHNEPTKHLSGLLFYLEWPLEEAEQIITALMEYSNDDDKSRIPTVRATYRRGEAGKKISGAGVLRKQINDDRVIDRILEWAGSPTINLLQEYNDRYAVVSVEGKFRIAATDVAPGEPPTFFMKDDWLNMTATDYTTIEDKQVSKGRLWLASPRRRSYSSVDFLPGDDDNARILNLWSGWAIEPLKWNGKKSPCAAFLELLRDVICGGDEELYTWMLHWYANIIREPMNKSLTAPVLIGKEGAGKSLSVAYFGKILGPGYTVITNEKHLYGQFNKHMATTLLLHSEEALYGGDRKHAGIIRSLITDNTRMFEQKGIDAKQVKNFLRLIILSNLPKAAPVMPGDRRYTVIDMKDRKVSDELLKRVLVEFNSDGPAALFHYLMTMKYDPALPRINIKNDSLAEMKSHNFDPLESWWHETLQSGQLLPDKLGWAQKPDNTVMWPQIVGSPALHAAMSVKLRNKGMRMIPSENSFALLLNKMVGVKLEKAQRSFSNILVGELGVPQEWGLLNDRQSAIINLPSLAECRAAFEKYVGQKLDWPQEDEPTKPGQGPATKQENGHVPKY